MASFLWGNAAQSDFDALLDKTTSDLLPNSTPPDLASSLELADRIRSSAITPAAATKSLLRRLNHDNPNVQLLALAVFDICVKNGGNAFLVQVASREVTNDLENLARGRMDGNRQVREQVLTRVQDWATAFMGKDQLRHSELVRVYDRMRGDGLPFPPRDPTATAAMIDSLSAPEWTDSTYCSRCRTDFSMLNRKHHCRNCGNVFDQACSSQSSPLPHFGVTEPVRVCDGCLRKVREGRGASGLSRSTSLGGGGSDRIGMPERSSTVSYPGGKRQHGAHRTSSSTSAIRSSGGRSKEEEDFQKAIAASLLDVGASSTSGPAFELRNPPPKDNYNNYSRSAPSQSYGPASSAEPDDPELAAAIAASLRDVAPAASAPTQQSYGSRYNTKSSYHPERSAPPIARYAPLPTYDLSSSESTSLENFSASVLAGPHAGQRMGERERMLYEKARSAVPRLERGLEDASRRREILVEMNEKLGEATRLYEGMLEERVRGASERIAGHSYGANPYSSQQPYRSAVASPSQQPYYPAQQQYLPNSYASPSSPPAPPQAFAPLPSSPYAPPPTSYTAYAPQQSYAPPLQPQQAYAEQPTASAPPPQQQAPIPNAYYKPSSFPVVPQGLPLPVNFPSVPVDNPWEEEERGREKEKASVGELIEL